MYLKYLNINLLNDTDGVLQDIHWYEGIFGYFPTYALGAMMSSQIKYNCPYYEEFLKKPEPENINNIANWLNKNIHQRASLYSSDEMLQNISGEKLNSSYYSRHLRERFVK
jgi:carboxypeptidase Taq